MQQQTGLATEGLLKGYRTVPTKIKGLEVQIEEATKQEQVAFTLHHNSPLLMVVHLYQLTSVETRLAELRSRLKDNDPLVEKLEREKKHLLNTLICKQLHCLEVN